MQEKIRPNYDLLIKTVVVGQSGVGKTKLVAAMTGMPFDDNYHATIGVDFRILTREFNSKVIKHQIWDTVSIVVTQHYTLHITHYKLHIHK